MPNHREPTADYQRNVADMVRREVHYCVSSLVSTLARGDSEHARGDLGALCAQAHELASPIPDYESAANEAGYQVRHDIHGFYLCTDEEAEHEDAGNPSAGFDGREHFRSIQSAYESVEDLDIEPHDSEVFEHWIVSDWLADKLEARGEKIDRDFAGLTVWARTTTGQAVSMDEVIRSIYDAMMAA